jgi:hypothetical protein
LLASVEADLSQRRERMELTETTRAWLAVLRQRLAEVEEETEEAFRSRRQLVKFLVAGITAGNRREDGSAEIRITYRFEPPGGASDESQDLLSGDYSSVGSLMNGKKHGKVKDNREWVKVHLMCGVNTKTVTSVEVSGWTAHDTNYFVPLVERTAGNFQLNDALADKAYLSRKNFKAVEELGGTPFVPFKKNTLEPTTEEEPIWAQTQMYYYFMYNRLEFMERYHMRSNVESAFSMVKGKFGDSVRSKSDTGQVNEALCKVLCHNICVLIHAIHALDVEPNFGAESRPALKLVD